MKSSRKFDFTGARAAMGGDTAAFVCDIAKELGVSESQIHALIAHRWLRLIKQHENSSFTTVEKPSPAGMVWLSQALGPIPMVPVVPTKHAAALLSVGIVKFRELLISHDVPVYVDPALGELMTISAFHGLYSHLYPWHERHRFDRQMFLSVLLNLDECDGVKFVRPKMYSEAIEEEIKRVAQLPEPQRSIRSVDIYDAYRDAKKIAVSLKKEPNEFAKRTIMIMESWKRKMDRSYSSSPSSSSPPKSPSSSSSSAPKSPSSSSSKSPLSRSSSSS